MTPPEILEAERLELRKPRVDDAPAIYEKYSTDTRVTKYLTWMPHPGPNTTKAFIEDCLRWWEQGSEYNWCIAVRPSVDAVGMMTFHPSKRRAALGYALAHDHWGQGYMTEAVQTIVDWALEVGGYHRVWATCDVENVGSERVMQKVGMKREGLLRAWQVAPNIGPESRDSWAYAITKGDRQKT